LQEFTQDANQEVRESCMVALDAADYWGHSGSKDDELGQEDGQDSKAALSFTHQKNERILVNHFNVE
jgi:hypothetical protein